MILFRVSSQIKALPKAIVIAMSRQKTTLRDWKRPEHLQKRVDANDESEASLPRSFHKHSITNLRRDVAASVSTATPVARETPIGTSSRPAKDRENARRVKDGKHKRHSRKQQHPHEQREVPFRKWDQYQKPGMDRRKLATEGA